METIRGHFQRSPDTVEKVPLRRAAHSLAELSKTGELSLSRRLHSCYLMCNSLLNPKYLHCKITKEAGQSSS